MSNHPNNILLIDDNPGDVELTSIMLTGAMPRASSREMKVITAPRRTTVLVGRVGCLLSSLVVARAHDGGIDLGQNII